MIIINYIFGKQVPERTLLTEQNENKDKIK